MIRYRIPAGTSQAVFFFSALLVGTLLMGAQSVGAQQFVVDDAGITDPGALRASVMTGIGFGPFARATVIGELFGVGSDVGVQGGLRVPLIADLLLIDATCGVAVSGDTPDIGFALGIALTPDVFFRPFR
jgi:hypothetical protein